MRLDMRCWWGRLKNRYQRGKRGWGAEDLWDLDVYLADWLPDALRTLADESHGYPLDIRDPDGSVAFQLDITCDFYVDRDGRTASTGPKEVWRNTLYRMADGIESGREEGLLLMVRNWNALWD